VLLAANSSSYKGMFSISVTRTSAPKVEYKIGQPINREAEIATLIEPVPFPKPI
jgi:hypothetical protein